MLAYSRSLLLAVVLVLPLACAPARTGVVGNTLSTNAAPTISLTAEPPLSLAGHGRLWVSPSSDVMGDPALASFDYALYTDPSAGPVQRFAYAAIVRLADDGNWYFEPQSGKYSYPFSRNTGSGSDDFEWTAQTLVIPSAQDWPSAVWQVNGRQVPKTWLAKRWTASMDLGTRAVAEYREAWPQCLNADADLGALSGKEGECLSEFNKRAEGAFAVSNVPANFAATPASPSTLALPEDMPNTGKLVGSVKRVDRGSSSYD